MHRQLAVLAGCLEVAIASRRKFLGDQAAGAEKSLDGLEEVRHFHDVDDVVPQVVLALGAGFLHVPCVRVVLVIPFLNLCMVAGAEWPIIMELFFFII